MWSILKFDTPRRDLVGRVRNRCLTPFAVDLLGSFTDDNHCVWDPWSENTNGVNVCRDRLVSVDKRLELRLTETYRFLGMSTPLSPSCRDKGEGSSEEGVDDPI